MYIWKNLSKKGKIVSIIVAVLVIGFIVCKWIGLI